MKKYIACFVSLVLFIVFLFPVTAQENKEFQRENAYTKIQSIEEQVISSEKILGSVRFDLLSAKSKSYLSSKLDLSTSDVGKIYYYLDDDNGNEVLTLKIITEGQITTITDYGKDENGNYRRLDNIDLISEFSNRSWTSNYVSGYATYARKVRFDSTIYYDYYTPNAGMTLYVRPYRSEFSYSYTTTATPSITNIFAEIFCNGVLCDLNENVIYDEYSWVNRHNISAPTPGYIYTRYNTLQSDRMIKFTNYSSGFYSQCSFYIDGVEGYVQW